MVYDFLVLMLCIISDPLMYIPGTVVILGFWLIIKVINVKACSKICRLEGIPVWVSLLPFSYVFIFGRHIEEPTFFGSKVSAWKFITIFNFIVAIVIFILYGMAPEAIFSYVVLKFFISKIFLEWYELSTPRMMLKCTLLPWYTYCLVLKMDESIESHLVANFLLSMSDKIIKSEVITE